MFRIGWIGSGFVGQVAHLTNYVEIPEVERCLLWDIRIIEEGFNGHSTNDSRGYDNLEVAGSNFLTIQFSY